MTRVAIGYTGRHYALTVGFIKSNQMHLMSDYVPHTTIISPRNSYNFFSDRLWLGLRYELRTVSVRSNNPLLYFIFCLGKEEIGSLDFHDFTKQ